LHTIHSTLLLPPIDSSYALYRYTYGIQHMLLPVPSHHIPQFPRHRKTTWCQCMSHTGTLSVFFLRTGLQKIAWSFLLWVTLCRVNLGKSGSILISFSTPSGNQAWLAGKSPINGGFYVNTPNEWMIFHCHVWLPDGTWTETVYDVLFCRISAVGHIFIDANLPESKSGFVWSQHHFKSATSKKHRNAWTQQSIGLCRIPYMPTGRNRWI